MFVITATNSLLLWETMWSLNICQPASVVSFVNINVILEMHWECIALENIRCNKVLFIDCAFFFGFLHFCYFCHVSLPLLLLWLLIQILLQLLRLSPRWSEKGMAMAAIVAGGCVQSVATPPPTPPVLRDTLRANTCQFAMTVSSAVREYPPNMHLSCTKREDIPLISFFKFWLILVII